MNWYDNGQKSSKGSFQDGEKVGKWAYWCENGQKIKEETYKDGELIDSKKY
jgi:antitoxin component YwqK of YwqJK toxin-antitoxin module